MEKRKMIRSLLVSTDLVYFDHYNSIFEQLWENLIDAKEGIKDIEDGVDLADVDVIPRSARTRLLYFQCKLMHITNRLKLFVDMYNQIK
jgi:hypothetical protein